MAEPGSGTLGRIRFIRVVAKFKAKDVTDRKSQILFLGTYWLWEVVGFQLWDVDLMLLDLNSLSCDIKTL